MKQLISFVQPNFKQGPGGIASYLPYSCGLLWSHALTNDNVKQNYQLHKFVYKREPLDELAQELSVSKVVAFSTYVWNRNYNFTLAQKIKDIDPNVFIVFGGPEPPITDPDIFSDVMPFCDVVVKQEGEFVFTSLLDGLVSSGDYMDIKGLLINVEGLRVDTGDSVRIETLDDVPSPYLSGIFDDILPLEKEWNGTLETNRGCPYKCTFCDWGSLTYSRMKKFGIDRVFDEIEWMGKNKIGYLDVADSNFGLFVERDNLIVDKLIEVQKKYGFPYRTGWSWAKNQKSEVVGIAKKLIESGHFNNGLTISLQSLDENTLKTIKRHNMGVNKINEIFYECKKEGVPLNVELIVGLPGETLETWEDTLYGVFEVGQHDSIEVWQAQILENAEMNLSQRDEFNIKGTKVTDYFPNGVDNEAPEFSEIVTETSTMSLDEMVEAYKLSWFLITWHTGGFSQYISRFLRRYKDISYKQFYTDFRKYLHTDSFWKQQEDEMTTVIKNWYVDGLEIQKKIGGVDISAATNQYRTLFTIHNNSMYDYMYILVDTFLKSYELSDDLYNDLTRLNKCVVTKHNDISDYMIGLNNTIFTYITDTESPLQNNKEVIDVYYPHDPIKSKDINWFMESIFYARRRSFGKNYLKRSYEN